MKLPSTRCSLTPRKGSFIIPDRVYGGGRYGGADTPRVRATDGQSEREREREIQQPGRPSTGPGRKAEFVLCYRAISRRLGARASKFKPSFSALHTHTHTHTQTRARSLSYVLS